jgi:hypothetical protein
MPSEHTLGGDGYVNPFLLLGWLAANVDYAVNSQLDEDGDW